MPRIGFVGAILISIVLIVGALWFRFIRIPQYKASLASLERVESIPQVDTLLEDFLNASTTLPVSSTTTPTKAGLIGQELFADYMALKSQGQVSSSTLSALANKYAKNITNFDLTIQKVNLGQITTVSDTMENLTTYGNTMVSIRNKYRGLVSTLIKENGNSVGEFGSSSFTTFMSAVGELYKSSADELLLIKVPASLSENHVNLTNNYLGNFKAIEIFSGTSQEPIQVYSAINIYTKNSEEETKLLLNIQKVMMANGIILESSL